MIPRPGAALALSLTTAAVAAILAGLAIRGLQGEVIRAERAERERAEAAALGAARISNRVITRAIENAELIATVPQSGPVLLTPAPRGAFERLEPIIDAALALDEAELAAAPLAELTQLEEEPGSRAAALFVLASMARRAGDNATARERYAEVCEIAPTVRDGAGLPLAAIAWRLRAEVEADEPARARALIEAWRLISAPELGGELAAEVFREALRPESQRLSRSGDLPKALRTPLVDALRADVQSARARRLHRRFAPRLAALAAAGTGTSLQDLDGERWMVCVEEESGGLEVSVLKVSRWRIAVSDELSPDPEFEYGLSSPQGLELGEPAPEAAPLARAALAPPFEGWSWRIDAARPGAVREAAVRRRDLGIGASALGAGLVALALILILRASRRELEAARARQAFLAAVTHELKTPIASIRLLAELSERPIEPERARAFAARIVAQSERLDALIARVLSFARLADPRAALTHRERIDLREVCDRAIAATQARLDDEGVELTWIRPQAPALVSGDPEALASVLGNLLSNALDHARPPLELNLKVTAGQARLTLADRGPGIPAELRGALFEPFVSEGGREDGRNFGLGLALAARLAQAHGGSLELTDRDGGGVLATLTLPLEEDDDGPDSRR